MKIIGAKSGGGKQRKPVIAPDSLQSKVYIAMLYGLSEGEIEGLSDGFKSIYLDDTSLKNDNGDWNFHNVSVDFRNGTNDQDYIEGFPDVASESAVNVELKHTTPWIKAFSNLDLNAVRVRLKWGALRTQNADNGDVSGVRIQYAIDLKTDNLAWREIINTQINAKTSTNYERSHRIDLPTAQTGWQIRVRRITPNSTSEYVSDKMYISAVTEVIDLKLRYPNTAILGLQYDAEYFSNVAKMAVRLKGLKIKVPSNYNAKERTYQGLWDGTFKQEYTNNPAWIYYDICTADRYGLGDRLKPFMVDKWSLYRLAQYCDELVDDGNGGQEPRFTLNIYIQSAEDAFKILGQIAGVFRAISYWDGHQIVCDADIPQDSMYCFSRANVIDGQFEYTGTRARDRHTVAKVAWDNADNHFKTEYEFIRDEKAIAKLGIRIADIQAWGCTSRGQAQRAGLWALKSEQLETRMVSFKVGLDGYIPQPGKVIEISDELFAGRANGGRVSAFNTKQNIITLDREITAKAGDKLIINTEHGIAQTRIIQSVKGRQITVTQPFEQIAVENVWVLDSHDLASMKFRVLSITQDEKHQFKITAVQYAPSKYDAIDTGAYIDERPISVINPTVQAPVAQVNINAEYRTEQGLNIANMVISFAQAQGAVKYQVEWRKDNGNWIKLPITGANSVEVQGIYAGQYQARVTAISAFDMPSLATYSDLTPLQGKVGKPPKLAKITATGTLFGMKLDWLFSAKSDDTAYTEIQVSPDNGSTMSTLGQFAYPTDTHQIQGLQANLTQYYRAKIVDKLGNESDWTQWVSGTSSADPQAVLDILEGQINESTLDGILTGKINNAVDTGVANTQAITAEQQARTKALAQEAQSRATAIRNEAIARSQEINQRVTALNSEIGTTIGELQNGLTQEIQQRKDGDSSTLAHLNAYKLSNDKAVSNALERINVTTSDIASNATKITALQNSLNTVNGTLDTKASTSALNTLQGQVTTIDGKVNAQASQITALQSNITTVKGSLATKLDSALISNYYTKAETDNVTAGKIDEFNTNLTIGGNNLIPESDKFRQGLAGNIAHRQILNDGSLKITGATNRFYNFISQQADLSLRNIHFKTGDSFIVSIWLKAVNPSQPPTEMPELYLSIDNAYKSNFEKTGSFENGGEVRYSQIRIANANRHLATPYVPHIGFSANAVGGGVIITRWQIQRGTKATDWTPALSDIDGKINTNAQAISTINSDVSTINGTLTAQSNQLTQLKNDLNTTNNNVASKANASALSALESNVSTINNTVISQSNLITALSGRITTAENSLKTKAESSAFNNYYTKQQTDNAIAGKVDEFSASLKIGGENLLRGTAEMKMGTGQWDTATFRPLSLGTAVTVDVPDSPVPLVKKGIRITSSRTSEFGIAQYLCPLDVGFYTLSYWVNGVAGDVVRLKPFWKDENQNTPSKRFTLKGGWERLTFTAENKVAGLRQHIGYIYLQPKVASNSLIVVAPMLEKATVASEWQPSQFDVQDNFNNLSSNITKTYVTKTELNNTKSEMTTALNSKLNTSDRNQIIADAQDGIKHIIDVSTLDGNTYYPVIIPLNHSRENKLSVFVSFNDGYTANWSTHSTKKWSVSLVWTDQGSGWGAQSRELVIDKFSYAWCANNQSPIIHVGQMTNSSYAYVFVRGGTKYNFYLSQGLTPQLKKDSFTQHSQTLNPQAYNANAVPKSMRNEMNAQATAINTLTTNVTTINGQLTTQAQQLTTLTTTQNNQATTINQQTQTINGISAVRAVTVDNNGVISGYGLMSELRNGRVTSQFGVNADTFYIGSPSNGKKPFIFNTSPRVIDGVSYPAGAWINSAYIANATIKMAHIDKASIASLSAITATIGTLRTKTTGARTEIKDNLIEVYDANNRLRVRMGVW